MEKPIAFRNKNRKQLIGILHLPSVRASLARGGFPLVIICHGFGGTKTSRRFVKLARALEKNRIASFRFDFEGCGDSEGNFETTTIKKQVSDLSQSLKLILKQKNINKNKIALVGHSLGAVIVALCLAKLKPLAKTLVFWAPAFNQKELLKYWATPRQLKQWKKQGFLYREGKEKIIGVNYLKENENKDYSPVLTQIKTPILIIHGQKDDVVLARFSKKLAKNYKNTKLLIFLKADHDFEDYYIQQRLIRETTNWLKEYLR